MERKLNKDVSSLQNGIKGLYRSSKFRLKIVVCCVLALILLLGATLAVYNANQWRGTVIVLSSSKGAYTFLYNPNFKVYGEKYDIVGELNIPSFGRFERKANVNSVTKTNLWESTLSSYGILDEVDVSKIREVHETVNQLYCYLIVINKNKEIVYQGFDRAKMVEALIKEGVRF